MNLIAAVQKCRAEGAESEVFPQFLSGFTQEKGPLGVEEDSGCLLLEQIAGKMMRDCVSFLV